MSRSPRILFTSFMGLPQGLSYFIPDAGLDLLLRTAIQAGAAADILDFNRSATLLACLDGERQRGLTELIVSQPENVPALDGIIARQAELRESFFHAAEGRIHQELRRRVSEDRVDLICMKIWLGEAFRVMLSVSRKLKTEFPGLRIAIGGPSISTIGDELLSFVGTDVDFVVFGEGEGPLAGLIALLRGELADAKNLPSCYYRPQNDDVFQLSEGAPIEAPRPKGTPFVDSYGERLKSEKIGVFLLEDSRGCSTGCSFCAHPNINTPAKLNADDTFEAFRRIYANGGRLFRLTGSSPSPAFLNALSDRILRENMSGCLLSAFLFPGYIRALEIDRARSAGFRAFLVGLENIDSSGPNDFTGDKFNQAVIADIAETFRRGNLFLCASMIAPQRDVDTSGLKRFLSLGSIDRDLASFLVHFPTVYPRTDWWRNPERFGISIDGKRDYLRSLVFRDEPDHSRLRIDGRSPALLWNELKSYKALIRSFGYSIGTNDETALIAFGLGQSPDHLDRLQRRLLATYDFVGLESLRARANSELSSSAQETQRHGNVGHG